MATVFRKGSKLGKYRLDRRLGQGSFADVWKARDLVEGVDVALKVAHPAAVAEWGRSAIEQEARIATRLRHPNIVAIRNADWIDGRFTIATDLAKINLASGSPALGQPRFACCREVARASRARTVPSAMSDTARESRNIISSRGTLRARRFRRVVAVGGPAAPALYTEAVTFGNLAPEQSYRRVRFASDVSRGAWIATDPGPACLPTFFECRPRATHVQREGARAVRPCCARPHSSPLAAAMFDAPSSRRSALERAFVSTRVVQARSVFRVAAGGRAARTSSRRSRVAVCVPPHHGRRVGGSASPVPDRCAVRRRCDDALSWCGSPITPSSILTHRSTRVSRVEKGVRPSKAVRVARGAF